MERIQNIIKGNGKQIDEEELLDIKIELANSIEGDMNKIDGIECEECKNRGYITIKKFCEMYNRNIEVVTNCKCMKKRKLVRNALNSGLGEYLNKTFDDYKAKEQWQINCKQKAMNYVKNNNKEWFIMCGQSGAGKTLLCSIISNSLLDQNHLVQYITWTDFISKLKRDIMGDNSNKVSDYLEELKRVEILFIDELLKKYNETDLKYIIEIINYRYTNNLQTIITSERNIDELLDIDEATFGRVIEKCNKNIIYIPKDRNKNYRLRKEDN